MPIISKKNKNERQYVSKSECMARHLVQAKKNGKVEEQHKCWKQREIVAVLRYRSFGLSRNMRSGVACLKRIL